MASNMCNTVLVSILEIFLLKISSSNGPVVWLSLMFIHHTRVQKPAPLSLTGRSPDTPSINVLQLPVRAI